MQKSSLFSFTSIGVLWIRMKIKIKMKASIGDIKFAVYYAPISSILNESKLEQIKLDASDQTATTEDKSVKSAPLLER